MNFKNFPRAQFSKLVNGINGVEEFLYDTIAKISYQSNNGMEIVRGGKISHTHTHTHTSMSIL